MAKRASGAKLFFYTLVGEETKLQIMADARTAQYDFDKLHGLTRRGDIVGVKGYPGKTKRGELSIFPVEFVVLTQCLHMLPGHTGLVNQETRYRMRCVFQCRNFTPLFHHSFSMPTFSHIFHPSVPRPAFRGQRVVSFCSVYVV